MAEQGYGDAGAEVEVAAAAPIEQVRALTALELHGSAFVDRQQRRHWGVCHVRFTGPEETLSLRALPDPVNGSPAAALPL
jgi:hypothetical protein